MRGSILICGARVMLRGSGESVRNSARARDHGVLRAGGAHQSLTLSEVGLTRYY